jgi:hypothetical protein
LLFRQPGPPHSVILTTAASANRMNGKGNCSGGVCTDVGSKKNQAKSTKG